MNREEIIRITNKLYKTTSLFPKKEPLRIKMREVSDSLLSSFTTLDCLNSENPGSFAENKKTKKRESLFEIEKNIELLDAYFNVARWQNWVSYFDIVSLQEDYQKIKEGLSEETKEMISEREESEESPPKEQEEREEKKEDDKEIIRRGLCERKRKIINFLIGKESVQVSDLTGLFPNIAKRTLRRDFLDLFEKGFVERVGEKNNTRYFLKE